MRMDILYQADENYAVFGGVSICSLFENNQDVEEICVHFLASGFDEKIKSQLKELEEKYHRQIIIYDAELIKKRVIKTGAAIHDGSYATYYKLFLEEFIPLDIERLLYLDDDTIVLGSLKELFTLQMGKSQLAIARDCDPLPFYDQTPEEKKRCRYNCGVMLINMKNWRENGCQKQIEEYMKSHTNYCHDQDILNRLYYEQIMPLPFEYNVTPILYTFSVRQYFTMYKPKDYYSMDEVKAGIQNIKIAHFFHWCGESAWSKGTLHPYRKLFQYYLSSSPWNDTYIPQKKQLNRVYRIEKFLYIILPKCLFFSIWYNYRKRHGLALIQD